MYTKALLIALFLAFSFSPIPTPANTLSVHVLSVVSGDTLKVRDDEGRTKTVKLYGIDAPEPSQKKGPEASKMIGIMTTGKSLSMEQISTDENQQPAILLYLNGVSLNGAMVKSGYAWVDDQNCKSTYRDRWNQHQDFAKRNKKGLWKDKDPIAPWNYRKAVAKVTGLGSANNAVPTYYLGGSTYSSRGKGKLRKSFNKRLTKTRSRKPTIRKRS